MNGIVGRNVGFVSWETDPQDPSRDRKVIKGRGTVVAVSYFAHTDTTGDWPRIEAGWHLLVLIEDGTLVDRNPDRVQVEEVAW